MLQPISIPLPGIDAEGEEVCGRLQRRTGMAFASAGVIAEVTRTQTPSWKCSSSATSTKARDRLQDMQLSSKPNWDDQLHATPSTLAFRSVLSLWSVVATTVISDKPDWNERFLRRFDLETNGSPSTIAGI